MKEERTAEEKRLICYMLDELEHPERPLSNWEEGFISSISDYWERNMYLSDRQFEKLMDIYEKRTA